MDLVLAGLSCESCLVYVDDIIVFGSTFEEHIERLKRVFHRLGSAGLKLKPSKCKLFQRRVAFLGHVVSRNGVEPDPSKVTAIVGWPVPRDVGEVRSFVGLASYYRSFIENFSAIAAPLFGLTKKGVPFVWDARCQGAFDLLKQRLTTAPVLASPRDGGGYVLDVDASEFAIGAVLQQWQDNQLRVIGYASRMLSAAERVYCTTRKEQLAIVYGLKQFRPYVLGQRTVVRSDHAALSYLKHAKEPVGQQARWLDFIEQFLLELRYRKGTSHANADALSRRPCENQGQLCRQCTNKSQAPEGHVVGPGPLGSVGQKEDCRTDYRAEAGYEDRPGCSTEKAIHSNAVTTRAQAQRKQQLEREGRAQSDTGLPPPADCSLADDASCPSNLTEYENIPLQTSLPILKAAETKIGLIRFLPVVRSRTELTGSDWIRPEPVPVPIKAKPG